MKKLILKIVAALVLATGLAAAGVGAAMSGVTRQSIVSGDGNSLGIAAVYAEECEGENCCAGVETSIIKCGNDEKDNGGGIFVVINIVLNVLMFGVGIAGTLGIVISGIMYLTARDNEAQMTKAKSRLINIAIGLIAYAVMWAFLQWLLPGGIFGN